MVTTLLRSHNPQAYWSNPSGSSVVVTSNVVGKPVGAVAGDMLLLVLKTVYNDPIEVNSAAVSGFTLLTHNRNSQNNGVGIAVFYRLLDGSEGPTFTVTGLLGPTIINLEAHNMGQANRLQAPAFAQSASAFFANTYTYFTSLSNSASWPVPWSDLTVSVGGTVDVNGGFGRMITGTAASSWCKAENSASGTLTDVDIVCKFTLDANEQYLSVYARDDGTAAQYPSNAQALGVMLRPLTSQITVVGANASPLWTFSYVPSVSAQFLRLQVFGSGLATTVRARVWNAGSPEPITWDVNYLPNVATPAVAGRSRVVFVNGAAAVARTAQISSITLRQYSASPAVNTVNSPTVNLYNTPPAGSLLIALGNRAGPATEPPQSSGQPSTPGPAPYDPQGATWFRLWEDDAKTVNFGQFTIDTDQNIVQVAVLVYPPIKSIGTRNTGHVGFTTTDVAKTRATTYVLPSFLDIQVGEPLQVANIGVNWSFKPPNPLEPTVSPSQIRRTGSFRVLGTLPKWFNPNTVRVRPYIEVQHPSLGTWIKFYVGTFVMSLSPTSDDGTVLSREYDLNDLTYVLSKDARREPLQFNTSTTVFVQNDALIAGVFGTFLQGRPPEVRPTSPWNAIVLSEQLYYDAGATTLEAINGAFSSIGMDNLVCDAIGQFIWQPLSLINTAPEWTYGVAGITPTWPGGEITPSMAEIPNTLQFVPKKGGPSLPIEGNGIRTITNLNTGPSSVLATGKNVYLRVEVDAKTQTELDAHAYRDAEWIFAGGGNRLSISVPINPLHDDQDVVRVVKPRFADTLPELSVENWATSSWRVTQWNLNLGPIESEDDVRMNLVLEQRVV